MFTLARILLTITVLGYGFATIKVDLNQTHAANPKWTPHARFHVVWQILSYTGIALVALYLIWIDQSREALFVATALSVAIYGGFFAAVLTRPLYGGGLYDDNSYPPFRALVGPSSWQWDANVTVFSGLTVVLASALVTLALH